MLEDVLGVGRVRVQVSAEIDLNRSTTTLESYDPESQVVRSSQIRELANEANGPSLQGAVTIANELPGADNNGANTSGTSEQSKTTEEVTNYEISKTVQTEVKEAGSIKRLSVAIVVDGKYVQDGNGASTYEARTEEELQQISSLIRSAIGFVAERGDSIEVINMQFAERPELAQLGTAAPGMFDFTRDDLMNAAEMIVTLLISIALLFFVMRPLVKRVLEPEEELLSPPINPNMAQGAAGSLPGVQQVGPDGTPMQNQEQKPPQSPAWMGQAKQMGEQQAKALTDVGTVIEESPKQAAMIVRNWLGEAA